MTHVVLSLIQFAQRTRDPVRRVIAALQNFFQRARCSLDSI